MTGSADACLSVTFRWVIASSGRGASNEDEVLTGLTGRGARETLSYVPASVTA
jgi:hypothetical protein